MGIPNQQFDEFLEHALKTDTTVTRRQRDAAWERLYQRAVEQVILPPYAIPPDPVSTPMGLVDRLVAGCVRMLSALVIDEDPYQRAASHRDSLAITGVMGASLIVHYHPRVYSRNYLLL